MKRSDLDTAEMLRLIDEMGTERRGTDTWQLFDDLMSGRVAPSPDVPARLPDVPYKVVVAKLEQLVRLRLIEYGTVITRPWLTDAGRARLNAAMRAS